ncbi:MAG: hypothetical protein ACJ786_29370, partial [Catenulispora sp.]
MTAVAANLWVTSDRRPRASGDFVDFVRPVGDVRAGILHAGQAGEHISGICFKTGPPRRIGAELEFTVHRAGSPGAYLD